MDKLLFIIPPSKSYEDFAHPKSNARVKEKNGKLYGHVVADMPIGIISLSAYIKKYINIDVKLIDFNVILNKLESFDYNSYEEFFEDVLMNHPESPTVIGISALFGPSYESVLSLAALCKTIFPSTPVLAGGAIPMNMYKEIFVQSDSFDALCYGEGEKPLLKYLTSDNRKEYLESSPSWITKNKANGNVKLEYDFIEDLDEIPFYDYDLCNASDYGISPAITAYSAVQKTANYHVMTSRGCPMKCTFCASGTVHGHRMRYFSINRVKEDLLRLKNEYDAQLLIFQDDHFLADKERALEIINFLKGLDIKVVFQNGLSLTYLDKDILVALKNIGIKQLVLPVESGSQRVLKELMHKPLTLERIQEVVGNCRELGIYTDINVILGMPGETEQDFQDALEFLKNIKANWFRLHVATPLVGSKMYDTCIEKGYLKESFSHAHYKNSIIETEFVSAERVEEWHHLMNLNLNFVYNYDLKIGEYETALEGFENSIGARPDLPFAYYHAAKCYEGIGQKEKAEEYFNKTRDIIAHSDYWKYYADMFKLGI